MSRTPAGPATKREKISTGRHIRISRWRQERVSISIKTNRCIFVMGNYQIGLSWFDTGSVLKKILTSMSGSNIL